MIDLKDFLPEGTRAIVKGDYLIVSRSGMRKLQIRRFVDDENLPVFFFGLGLFAGEGRQRFTNTTERIEFINAQLAYVKLFQRFLELLNLGSSVKARIQLKSGLDYERVLGFWSDALGFQRERFRQPLIFPKKPRKEGRTRISSFGSLELIVNSALAFKLVRYWMQVFLIEKTMGPPGFEPGTNRL